MLSFIKRVLMNQKISYLRLLTIMAVFSSFEWTCVAMYSMLSSFDLQPFTFMIFSIIPSLGAFIALTLSVFVTKYFIENKKQEFSILLLVGRKPKDLFYYIFIQFGSLLLIASLLGIGGGYLLIELIKMNFSQFLLSFSLSETLFIYASLCFCTFILIFAVSTRQFVTLDNELILFLSHKESSYEPPYQIKMSATHDSQKVPIASIIFSLFMFYITGYCLFELIHIDISSSQLYVYYMIVLFGIVNMIQSIIPLMYDLTHHYLIKRPLLLHGLSNFFYFLKTMSTLVILSACLIPTFVLLILSTGNNTFSLVFVIPSFMMTMIMIVLCFVLKYSFYNQNLRPYMMTYHAIGYNSHQLSLILLIKNLIFFILGMIIPLGLFLRMILMATSIGNLSKNVSYLLISVYIVLYVYLFMYIFFKEKKMLKEVTHHVKYINRS